MIKQLYARTRKTARNTYVGYVECFALDSDKRLWKVSDKVERDSYIDAIFAAMQLQDDLNAHKRALDNGCII